MLRIVERFFASSSRAVPATDLQRAAENILHRLLRARLADHDIDGVLLEALELLKAFRIDELSIDQQLLEAVVHRPLGDLGVKTFPRLDERRENLTRPFRASSSVCRVIAVTLWLSTASLHFGQNCVPSFAKRRRRK